MTKEFLETKSKEELIQIILDMQNNHHTSGDDMHQNIYDKLSSYEVIHSKLTKIKNENSKVCIVLFKVLNVNKLPDIYNAYKPQEVLDDVAKLLIKKIRLSDIFLRFNQNQFLIIIPDTSLVSTQLLAKKLNKLIYENIFSNISHLNSNFCVTEFKDNDDVTSVINKLSKCLDRIEKSNKEDISTI